MVIISKSIAETTKIAKDLALKILRKEGTKIIALEGELGAGKTAFTKALAKALGIKNKITSPTFVILKRYPLASTQSFFYHIDAYRLKSYKDLEKMDIKQIIGDNSHIIVIEWADRVAEILPSNTIKIHIDHVNASTRKFTILY